MCDKYLTYFKEPFQCLKKEKEKKAQINMLNTSEC